MSKELKGRGKSVRAVFFLPNGKELISSNADQTVQLWDVQTGKLVTTLARYAHPPRLALAPNGRTFVCSVFDPIEPTKGRVEVCEVQSGKMLWTVAQKGYSIYALTFSPDSNSIACATGNFVELRNAQTGQLLHTIQNISFPLVFSPDGATIAEGRGDDMTALRKARTGELLHTLNPIPPAQRDRREINIPTEVSALCFAPDGKTLFVGSHNRLGKVLQLWSVETGAMLRAMQATSENDMITALALSPDGQTLAVADLGGRLILRDGRTLRSFGEGMGKSSRGTINCLDFSPDRVTLASGHQNGTIALWHIK